MAGSPGCLHNDEGVHHVVILVLQDVAVPHVLRALDAIAGLQSGTWRCARGHAEGRDHRRDLTGIRSKRLFPARFVGVRWPCGAWNGSQRADGVALRISLPRFPADDLSVDEMQMYRMGVAREIVNLPDLRFSARDDVCMR